MKKIIIAALVFITLTTSACIIKDEEITYSAKKPVEAPTATPKPIALEEYPETIIQWMIPFSQGTDVDNWSRAMGRSLTEVSDWKVMYTNISGGLSGSTGMYKVLNSKHDGYMFAGLTERSLSVPIYVEGEMTSKDWEYYIAGGSPQLLCITKELGPNTLEEFVVAAQNIEEDNELSFAISGGGLQAALPFYFMYQSELEFDIVEFDTEKDAIEACSKALVDAIIMPANIVASDIASGDLIPIAVMEDEKYTNHNLYEETIPSVRSQVPMLKQEALIALRQLRGFAVPSDTDKSLLLSIERDFATLADSTFFNEFVKQNYANVYLYSGNEARQQIELSERYLCWILSDMHKGGFTPEYVGIERPY